MINPLLQKQIMKHLGDYSHLPEDLKLKLENFFEIISQTYDGAEKDRMLMERSLELTSKELRERYDSKDDQNNQ